MSVTGGRNMYTCVADLPSWSIPIIIHWIAWPSVQLRIKQRVREILSIWPFSSGDNYRSKNWHRLFYKTLFPCVLINMNDFSTLQEFQVCIWNHFNIHGKHSPKESLKIHNTFDHDCQMDSIGSRQCRGQPSQHIQAQWSSLGWHWSWQPKWHKAKSKPSFWI